ncbi:MAG: PIN domain-containing protein [Euryarchaeota archaeon]|nr:PIN domain-containing protein [Euryarchaeota archaeon]
MTIADTTFIIDILSGDTNALNKLDDLVARNEPLWMPAVVLHELEYGAGLHHDPEAERARIQSLEAALPVVPFDAAQARIAGDLEARLELAGKRPGRVDVQIAALAQTRGESVLTRDERFPHTDEVRIERY